MTTLQQPGGDTSDPERGGGGPSVDKSAAVPLKVFISYRHEDTQITAWMLYSRLEERFGATNVFFDQGTLRPGMRWFAEIKSHLAGAHAFIALIGPKWMPCLTARQQQGGDDHVARETDLALRSGPAVTVIPVLVEDAELPYPGELPPSLRALSACQVELLRNSHLLDDIEHLIARLGEITRTPPPAAAPSLAAPRPVAAPRLAAGPGPAAVALAPDEDHYRMVVRHAGNLVVFLGADANADDRHGPWREGSGVLPDDRDLARYLASCVELGDVPARLAEVAQYAGTVEGEPELFHLVSRVLRVDPEPGPVHRDLARLPARLGHRYQMVVTPKYDVALEKAFTEANEAFDVAVYMAPGTEQAGRFVHVPWGQPRPRVIDKPNEYSEFPIVAGDRRLRRTVIVRVNGAVDDRLAGFPWEDNYVITEDHYINYLAGRAAEEVVPGQILAKLRNASYLFLGYPLADWRLRVFLQRIWKGPKLGRAKYWAVEHRPDVLEKDLWQQAGVSLYQSSLTDYLKGLYAFLDDHPEGAQP